MLQLRNPKLFYTSFWDTLQWLTCHLNSHRKYIQCPLICIWKHWKPRAPTSRDSFSSFNSSIGSPQHSSSPKTDAKPTDLRKRATLRVLILNLQSMRAKRTPFWLLLEEVDPNIIIGCETWLHQGIYEREVLPANYHMVARKDMQSEHQGGVMIAACDIINGTEISLQTHTELATASFDCPDKSLLVIGAFYRPPNSDQAYMEELCSKVKELSTHNSGATMWIAGDINLPDIN